MESRSLNRAGKLFVAITAIEGNEMNQLNLGFKLKERGLDLVEEHNLTWIETARAKAIELSKLHGSVTADDVRRNLCEQPDHPNAWGALFRGKNWQCLGFRKSTIPSCHARTIRIWRWIG